MLSRFSIASDYATCSGGGTEFYFGYEHTVGDEWAFTATVDGKEVMRIPKSKLGVRSDSDMGEFLLAGISLWLQARQTHSEQPSELVNMAYRLARHLRNTDTIEVSQWAAQAGEMLAEFRAMDQDTYESKVKR